MGHHVLVVDDEEMIRRSLRLVLEAEGYQVTTAANAAEGRALLESEPPDCAVLDLRLGDGSGLDLLREGRTRHPGLKAILISAHGDLESAVEALRLGAYDFIRKPFEVEEVVNTVGNALRTERLEDRLAYFEGREQRAQGGLIFASSAMRKAMEQVDRFAAQPVPVVLVQGESGTGKELVARALHDRSSRREGPFVELNCSALPEQLVESELFGHERGAFSDAREQKKGLVELADGGTLFLDEIGDLAPAAQAKLLKFVETKELRRVGGTRTLKVDCRIVAATHRDLADAERFRQDLYFRLAGLTITLPPLRDRDEDALVLARHFLREFALEYRKPLTGFSPEAERALLRHSWPGNVRELRAAISYAAMMAEQPVVNLELPEQVLRASVIPPLPKRVQDIVRLDEIEVQYCRGVLALCKGNRVLAAEKLGINRHTLAKKAGEGEGSEEG
jgi:DNA-binding NtrC family response regulator